VQLLTVRKRAHKSAYCARERATDPRARFVRQTIDMRSFALRSTLVVATLVGPALAQSTASFPEAGASRPAEAPPQAPAPDYSNTAHAGWGGAAMTSAPASVPVAGAGFGWSGSWEQGGPSSAAPDRDQAPAGYRYEEHTSATPIVVGGLMLAIPYATGLGIAGAEDFANASGWLAVPALGPWLALSGRGDPCDRAKDAQDFNSDVGNCVAEPFVRGMLVLDGVLQATGAVVMIIGASSSDKRLVPIRERTGRVVAMPQPVGRSGYGMGVVGSF
jgi:hypothetical protein